MSCKNDDPQGSGCPLSCPLSCPRVLSRVIKAHLTRADEKLEGRGYLPPLLFIRVKNFVYVIGLDFTDRTATQTSLETIRDCCVAFMPETVSLLREGWVSSAADASDLCEVVAMQLEAPSFDAQIVSRINRDENGAYAGLDTPQRCDDDFSDEAGVTGFYPSMLPSPQERDAARDRLRRVLEADLWADICATADQPAQAA